MKYTNITFAVHTFCDKPAGLIRGHFNGLYSIFVSPYKKYNCYALYVYQTLCWNLAVINKEMYDVRVQKKLYYREITVYNYFLMLIQTFTSGYYNQTRDFVVVLFSASVWVSLYTYRVSLWTRNYTLICIVYSSIWFVF